MTPTEDDINAVPKINPATASSLIAYIRVSSHVMLLTSSDFEVRGHMQCTAPCAAPSLPGAQPSHAIMCMVLNFAASLPPGGVDS
jgi:hypothetical protein